MSDDPTRLRVASEGPEHALGVELLYAIGDAITAIIEREPDTGLAMTIAVSACAQMAGRIFGNLLAQGIARDGDKRRAGETVLANFRLGTANGRDVMLEATSERFGGRA